MRIDVVVYDGFDDLDAFGPYEVLRHAARQVGGWDVALVGIDAPGEVVTAHGVRLRVDEVLGERAPDGVVVPGGGWKGTGPGARAEVERGELPRRLAELAPRLRWTASVCTGAMLLSAAGLLRDRPCVTHRSALDDLRAAGALVDPDSRVVDDGDVVTGGGVTSGLDVALHLVEREAGADLAATVAGHIEYDRRPVTRTVRGLAAVS